MNENVTTHSKHSLIKYLNILIIQPFIVTHSLFFVIQYWKFLFLIEHKGRCLLIWCFNISNPNILIYKLLDFSFWLIYFWFILPVSMRNGIQAKTSIHCIKGHNKIKGQTSFPALSHRKCTLYRCYVDTILHLCRHQGPWSSRTGGSGGGMCAVQKLDP